MLFPRACGLCRSPGPTPCPACTAALRAAGPVPCPPGLDSVASLVAYDGVGRALVLALKYGHRRSLARPLGRALAGLLPSPQPGPRAALAAGPVSAVTWVPTTPSRRRRRGYDQGQLLARQVAHTLGVPCRRLLRRAGGPPQSRLSAAERRAGPHLAVHRRGRVPAEGVVVVVDDVVTTGASLSAAARALREAGAGAVAAVTVAATPLKVGRPGAEIASNPKLPAEEVLSAMQVTETQVQRSLAALEADECDPAEGGAGERARDLPAGLVEQLTESPPIRSERLAEARRRLAAGEQPTAEALARRMVGRLVCDRLR